MASRVFPSSFVFSMARVWSSFEWLGIGGEISKIVPSCRYWRSYSSGSCVLDNWVKEGRYLGVLPERVYRWVLLKKVFRGAMSRFRGKKVRRVRGEVCCSFNTWLLVMSCVIFVFEQRSEKGKKVRREAKEDKSRQETVDLMSLTCSPLIYFLLQAALGR